MKNSYLSERIKDLRKELGLSQEKLAKKIGVSRTAIKNAETKITFFPNPIFLSALSKFLNLSNEEMLSQILYWQYKDQILFDEENYSKKAFACLTSHEMLNSWQLIDNIVAYSRVNGTLQQAQINEHADYYASVLRISHNPTRMALICMVNGSDVNNYSKLADELITAYEPSTKVDDRVNPIVKFIIKTDATDKYEVMKNYKLTEKPNKLNHCFLFYGVDEGGNIRIMDGEFYNDL